MLLLYRCIHEYDSHESESLTGIYSCGSFSLYCFCFFQWYLAALKVALGRNLRTLGDLTGTAQVVVFSKGPASLQRRRDDNEREMQHWQI